MIVRDQLAAIFANVMRQDQAVVLLGEDVRDGGGLGLSRACVTDPDLLERLIATPLVPASLNRVCRWIGVGGAQADGARKLWNRPHRGTRRVKPNSRNCRTGPTANLTLPTCNCRTHRTRIWRGQ